MFSQIEYIPVLNGVSKVPHVMFKYESLVYCDMDH